MYGRRKFDVQSFRVYSSGWQSVSAYQENQRDHKTHTTQAQQARTQAQSLQEDCDRLEQAIDAEERHAAQISAQLRQLAHQRNANNRSNERDASHNEEAQLSQQLERIQTRILALSQNLRSSLIQVGQLEGRAQESEQQADHLVNVMDNTRDKCGKIADILDNHAGVIKAEAERAQKQADQFSSLTSNRFGSSGANAASQRQAYAQNLDSVSENTSQLAQQYRFLADNAGNWSFNKDRHDILSNLSASNPNYDEDSFAWSYNCQRCVPTYEMRRRGYNVTAQPISSGSDHLAYHPFDVWQNYKEISCSGSGLSDIRSAMSTWGDGARAQVVVYWNNGEGGHTFAAEQVNGKTYFVDHQTNSVYDADWVFSKVEHGATSFCRIDNLKPSSWVLKCCKEA